MIRIACTFALLCFTACARPPAPAPAPAPARREVSARAIGGDGMVTASLVTSRGTLSVDEHGVLSLLDSRGARELDQRVVPELSYASAVDLLVYPRRTTVGSELVARSLSDNTVRTLTTDLTSADRPALSPDGALVAFWGSDENVTIVGMYIVDLRLGVVRRLNNRDVAIGAPGFVEPPVERSFRFVSSRVVRWTAADGEHTADLSNEGAPQ